MNDGNRATIVLLAALVLILAAVVIYLTWAYDQQTVTRLRDWVDYLDRHRDNTGRLIVTLGAAVVGVLALFVIVLELAPEEQAKELRVERAGATTIVPAEALRLRLREALLQLPGVGTAGAKVWTRDKGIAAELSVTLEQQMNVANVSQEAGRVGVEVIQNELGLPLSGVPAVRISFAPRGGQKVAASSVSREPEPELGRTETVDERFEGAPERPPAERPSQPAEQRVPPAEQPAQPAPPAEGGPGEQRD